MCYDLQNGFFIIDYMACGVLPNRKKGEPTSGVPPPKRPFPCRLQGGLVPPLPRPRRMPLAHRTRQRPDVPRPLPAPLARVGALLSPLVQRMPPPPRPIGMPLARAPRQTPHILRLVPAILARIPHLTCLRSPRHQRTPQNRQPNSQHSHPSVFHPSPCLSSSLLRVLTIFPSLLWNQTIFPGKRRATCLPLFHPSPVRVWQGGLRAASPHASGDAKFPTCPARHAPFPRFLPPLTTHRTP